MHSFMIEKGRFHQLPKKQRLCNFFVLWMLKMSIALFFNACCNMNIENCISKCVIGINQVCINCYSCCQLKILLNSVLLEITSESRNSQKFVCNRKIILRYICYVNATIYFKGAYLIFRYI